MEIKYKYVEIEDKNYVINTEEQVYYTVPGATKKVLLAGFFGLTYKQMRNKYPGMLLFKKEISPRFKTDKPYPFGY